MSFIVRALNLSDAPVIVPKNQKLGFPILSPVQK